MLGNKEPILQDLQEAMAVVLLYWVKVTWALEIPQLHTMIFGNLNQAMFSGLRWTMAQLFQFQTQASIQPRLPLGMVVQQVQQSPFPFLLTLPLRPHNPV